MIVCGIDIKGKEAVLAIVNASSDGCAHVSCTTKKLALLDDRDKNSLLTLKAAVDAFARQNSIGCFVIKSRQATGPKASGGITFKIEMLFQLSDVPVVFANPVALSKFAKTNLGGVPSSVADYQASAYRAGVWYLTNLKS